MTANLSDRFGAMQSQAGDILSRLDLMRMVCDSDTRCDEESVRAAGFVGRQFVAYAIHLAYEALRIPRRVNGEPVAVPIFEANGFDRFLERCSAAGGRLGVPAELVGNGALSAAELALRHAEDALRGAYNAYSNEGLDLAARCGHQRSHQTDDAEFIAMIERQCPELADAQTALRFRSNLVALIWDCRANAAQKPGS